MQIVPVIDLMSEQVVHARRGERDRYQPLDSALCQGAAPLTVVAALLALHPFRALYIADLDAIRARGNHSATIARIRAAHPGLELWVDAGIADHAGYHALHASGCVPIIGSESLSSTDWLAEIPGEAAILSLDHRGGERLGPQQLWSEPRLWPQRVLAMNLHRVGADAGPDLALIAQLQAQGRSETAVYAAGGVRGAQDLVALQGIHAAGALVATALHNGALSTADVERHSASK